VASLDVFHADTPEFVDSRIQAETSTDNSIEERTVRGKNQSF
jgi:hypothetical protein